MLNPLKLTLEDAMAKKQKSPERRRRIYTKVRLSRAATKNIFTLALSKASIATVRKWPNLMEV